MCGIFGFLGARQNALDLPTLKKIALVTEARGKHAFGWAWVSKDGHIHSYKMPGEISKHMNLLDMVKDAEVVIGHTRWATHGDPKDNANNHPFACDGGWLVHNGIVSNYAALANENEIVLQSECDSEIIAALAERSNAATVLDRMADAIAQTNPGPLAVAALWARPTRLVIAKRGNPLSFGRTRGGSIYFASLPTGLPGTVKPVGQESIYSFELVSWRKDNGKVRSRKAYANNRNSHFFRTKGSAESCGPLFECASESNRSDGPRRLVQSEGRWEGKTVADGNGHQEEE